MVLAPFTTLFPVDGVGDTEQLPAWEDQLPVAFSAATRPHRLAQWAGRIPEERIGACKLMCV